MSKIFSRIASEPAPITQSLCVFALLVFEARFEVSCRRAVTKANVGDTKTAGDVQRVI